MSIRGDKAALHEAYAQRDEASRGAKALDAIVRGLRSQLDWYEGWVNEVAALLPERDDGEEAQESIILSAVADLVAAETYWHAEAEKWMRMTIQSDGEVERLTGDLRAANVALDEMFTEAESEREETP